MSFTLSENKNSQLRRFWLDIGGLDRLTGDFVNELIYYMKTTSELITDTNKQIETEESNRYKKVANTCDKLLAELTEISELDRINILSLRQKYQEFGEKSLPMCDPLEYVETIKELADNYSYELKKCAKYERQWKGLENFKKRFPPCKNLTKEQFKDLFCILYQPETDEMDRFRESLRKSISNFK